MQPISNITIDVAALVSFYDGNPEVREHSNAIKTLAGEELGFALLEEYFRRNGVETKVLRPCTTGSRKGPRLDGWVIAKGETSEPTYYQVEVKSWSIHGVGGDSTPLPLTATADELAAYKKRLWSRYWTDGQFTEPRLNKVLTPMKGGPEWKLIEPLACVWSAMHPQGMLNEFFSVPLNSHRVFQHVWVFSMSSFLRNIIHDSPRLKLNLPSTAKRINLLRTLFDLNADAERVIQPERE
jgi:hypothetical protein